MGYLETPPRKLVTVYLPLVVFLFVLLFPFYWMAITSVKPDDELLSRERQSVLGDRADARALRQAAVRDLLPGVAVEHGAGLGGRRPSSRSPCSVFAAYAIERLRFPGAEQVGPVDLPRLPRAAVDPVHPARGDRLPARPVRHALGADPHLPDLPDPVLHLAADGLLPLDPVRARGMRADRRRHAAGRS